MNVNDYLSDLLSYEPATSNMFEVRVLDRVSRVAGDSSDSLDQEIYNYAMMHAIKVDFPDEVGFDFKRNDYTRAFTIDEKFTHLDSVTITWQEDTALTVRRFHTEWLNLFYDRHNDRYLSANSREEVDKRYKTFRIYLQGRSVRVGEDFRNLAWIDLYDILPPKIKGGPELDFENSNITTYTMTYKVESWHWSFEGDRVDVDTRYPGVSSPLPSVDAVTGASPG